MCNIFNQLVIGGSAVSYMAALAIPPPLGFIIAVSSGTCGTMGILNVLREQDEKKLTEKNIKQLSSAVTKAETESKDQKKHVDELKSTVEELSKMLGTLKGENEKLEKTVKELNVIKEEQEKLKRTLEEVGTKLGINVKEIKETTALIDRIEASFKKKVSDLEKMFTGKNAPLNGSDIGKWVEEKQDYMKKLTDVQGIIKKQIDELSEQNKLKQRLLDAAEKMKRDLGK